MPQSLILESISEDHWEAILYSLKEKVNPFLPAEGGVPSDCILVLGPEALVSKEMSDPGQDHKPMLELLCESAMNKMKKEEKIKLEEANPLFSHFVIMEYFKDAYTTSSDAVWYKLYREIYRLENLHSVFYEKLPFIPFPIIINTSPDILLFEAFRKAGIQGTQFSFFNYRLNSEQNKRGATLAEPTLDKPIIYNLFGYIDKPQSTVGTPDELLEYVFSILTKGQDQLDALIYSGIKSAKNIIFLGFDFESWHLKILLRYFEIKKDSKATYARPWKLEREETQKYFKKLFNVTFVKDNIVEFLTDLHLRCEKDKDITLRQASENKEISFKEELRTHLKKNEFEETLRKLEQYARETNNPQLLNQCTTLFARFYQISEEETVHGRDVGQKKTELNINLQTIIGQMIK